MKCQDKLASDHIKTVILYEYKELFSGIGKVDDEISITLKPMHCCMLHQYEG